VTLLIALYERSPTPETLADLTALALSPLRLEMSLDPTGALEAPRCRQAAPAIDRYLTRALRQELDRPVWYDSTCPGNQVRIRAPVTGGVLEVKAFRDRVQAKSGPLFVAWILGATLFLCVVSILFIRNQVRPIEQLAEAMARFGRGEEVGLYKARGAREVRAATHAFFGMRSRIKRHIDQRAQLLAGVSHDLRTPLTRLKLQFALMPDSPELEAAKLDLGDMDRTIGEYLAFAKAEWIEEFEPTDLGKLVGEAVEAARRSGRDIAYDAPQGPIEIPARPGALRRCLGNLIDNAMAHGSTVKVAALVVPGAVEVHVEDDGPGIEPARHEDAFRPFSRLDETGARNAKGVGLGLAIARDAARAHGGDITLGRSALGGLRAVVRLPTPA
jgi:two-component system osmolarity sensor histidine kinase EnvZ